MRFLRRLALLRRLAAASVLALFLFALPGGAGETLMPVLGMTQAGMALAGFLAGGGAPYGLLLAAQALAALLCGRVFCSWLCPLGAAQDIYRRLRNAACSRIRKRPPAALRHIPGSAWRYAPPGLLFACLFWQGPGLFGLAEPFSLFARAVDALVRPAQALAVNALADAGDAAGLFVLPKIVWLPDPAALAAAGLPLLAVLWLAGRGPRAAPGPRGWCNAVCPVGALLGLISGAAYARVRFTHECSGCGRCERVCKARCIDSGKRAVDASRCVACYACLESCPSRGLALLPRPRPAGAADRIRKERAVLLRGAATGAALALAGIAAPLLRRPEPAAPGTGPGPRAGTGDAAARPLPVGGALPALMPVLPPGALSLSHFAGRCTGCHSCLAACPPRVLRMSGPAAWGERRAARMTLPAMDYMRSFCQIGCARCTGVCPSGALSPLTPEEKKRVQIGRAALTEALCVIVTEKTRCGACAEHCPTGAVAMGPDTRGGMDIPVIDADRCIGCGACQYACPVRPRQAVLVAPLAVHAVALPPRAAEGSGDVDGTGAFPF